MLQDNTSVFMLCRGAEDHDVLHEGVVLESPEDRVLLVRFAETIQPVLGDEVELYYDMNQTLTRTTATVVGFPQTHPYTAILFAISEESQQAGLRAGMTPIAESALDATSPADRGITEIAKSMAV